MFSGHFAPRMKLPELDEKISSIGFQGRSDAVIKLDWRGLRISRNWRYRDSTDFSLCLRNQFHPSGLFQLQQFSLLSSVDKYLSRIPRSMVKLNGFRKISAAPASRARFVTLGSWKAMMMI